MASGSGPVVEGRSFSFYQLAKVHYSTCSKNKTVLTSSALMKMSTISSAEFILAQNCSKQISYAKYSSRFGGSNSKKAEKAEPYTILHSEVRRK